MNTLIEKSLIAHTSPLFNHLLGDLPSTQDSVKTLKALETTGLPSVEQLVAAMTGKASTNKWDVVCSYGLSEINQFLKDQYVAGKLVREVELKEKTTDMYDDPVDVTFNLVLSEPMLSFTAGLSGAATLIMWIEAGSKYTLTPEGGKPRTKELVGHKYYVKAVVPLAAISGDTGKITPAGDVIVFDQGKPDDQHVILHFKHGDGVKFTVEPPPDPEDKSALAVFLLPLLSYHFQNRVKELDYALTAVNNQTAQAGDFVLTPSRFVFSSWSDGTTGVLSLYMNTVGADHGDGNASPSFQPGDLQMAPIPSGYSASIILSNDLFTKRFLQSKLTADGYTVSFLPTNNGISFELRANKSVIGDGKSSSFIFGNSTYKGLSVSLNNFPVRVKIYDTKIKMDWSASTDSEWSQQMLEAFSWGAVTVGMSVNKPEVELSTLSDTSVAFADVEIQKSDISISVTSKGCSFWEAFNHCMSTCPSYYSRDMSITLPSIKLSMPSLNFFATTNLLSPGNKVISVATDAKMRIPHDVLILGKVVQK
ncbi:MAG: hypothetical protein ACO1SV_14190 [Fimbriimonas sp.]